MEVSAMSFIQIVEYETDRADELAGLMDEEQAAEGVGLTRYALTQDRDNPKHYYMIVEFDSYDHAMQNSSRPETDAMAQQMSSLVSKGPIYHNLNVLTEQP
jgi:quinol monooxygenase YgiN